MANLNVMTLTHKVRETCAEVIGFFTLLLKEISENPAREIRILLGFIEGRSQEFYFFNPDYVLENNVIQALETLIQRRCNHEPLSKIIGEREFYGRMFRVTKDTLDPRFDTETVIEAALKYAPTLPKPLRILDLGTGTGCILLTLLLELPEATGVGLDISEEALTVAMDNAQRLGVAHRAEFRCSNWCEALEEDEAFSLIVSNPPYIGKNEKLDENVLHFDPHLALFAGEDGLQAYRDFAPYLKKHLQPEGRVVVEFGKGQEEDVYSLFKENALTYVQPFRDIQGIVRSAVFA